MAITITTLGEQSTVEMKALVDSAVEDNFISQYTVKELGLIPHEYTRAWMLDGYEMVVYENHIIKYWLTDSYGQQHSREVLFVAIRFTEYDFVLGWPWLSSENSDIHWPQQIWCYQMNKKLDITIPESFCNGVTLPDNAHLIK